MADTEQMRLFIVENSRRGIGYKVGYSDMSELDMVLIPEELFEGLDGSDYVDRVYQDTDNHVHSVSMKEVVQFYIDNNQKFRNKEYNIREITNG